MKKREPWRPGMKIRDSADRRALMAWAISADCEATCGRCGGEGVILSATKAPPRGRFVCKSRCESRAVPA